MNLWYEKMLYGYIDEYVFNLEKKKTLKQIPNPMHALILWYSF